MNTSDALPASYTQRPGETEAEQVARLQGLLIERDSLIAELRGRLSSCSSVAVADPTALPCFERQSEAPGGIEEVEARLAQKSQNAQSPLVQQVLSSLQEAAVYTDTPNHETNRKLWDAYAQNWADDQEWLQRMASNLPGGARALACVGDEWADRSSLEEVLADWLFPHLGQHTCCAEVGSGGGRIAELVAGRVAALTCLDISKEMLKAAQAHLAQGHSNVTFRLIKGDENYPVELVGNFDFVYSFDVFVHMDLHQMRRTLLQIRQLLKPGAQCFLSFANLLAPAGWHRFSRQKQYSVGGFYFVSPDIVRCLLAGCGLEVQSMSSPREGNTYLSRDLLVLARKP